MPRETVIPSTGVEGGDGEDRLNQPKDLIAQAIALMLIAADKAMHMTACSLL
jgi:hypothetical protein